MAGRSLYLVLALGCSGAALAVPARKAPAPAARAAAPRKPVLKVFTFKSVTAGEPVEIIGHLWCVDARADEQNCKAFYENSVAGVAIPEGIYYTLYQHQLSSMHFPFANQGAQFELLALAFEEKYGAPCTRSTAKWQNRAGAVFDNVTITWCFSSGKLMLEQRSSDRDTGVVEYLDDNHAPSAPVPKDF